MAKLSRLRDQLYMLQGSRCFYCDRAIAPQDRSLEHIIADSIGGFANDENAVVVCQDANHLLGDTSPKRKMLMLKAGGGKIECPKLGNCTSKTYLDPGSQLPAKVHGDPHQSHKEPMAQGLKAPSNPPPASQVSKLPNGQAISLTNGNSKPTNSNQASATNNHQGKNGNAPTNHAQQKQQGNNKNGALLSKKQNNNAQPQKNKNKPRTHTKGTSSVH